MRLGAILFTLGYGGCMIALLMLLPWVASLLDPGYSHAGNFTIGLMLSAFVSGALLLSGYTSRRHRANGIELFADYGFVLEFSARHCGHSVHWRVHKLTVWSLLILRRFLPLQLRAVACCLCHKPEATPIYYGVPC